jgi:hypothetical protein
MKQVARNHHPVNFMFIRYRIDPLKTLQTVFDAADIVTMGMNVNIAGDQEFWHVSPFTSPRYFFGGTAEADVAISGVLAGGTSLGSTAAVEVLTFTGA